MTKGRLRVKKDWCSPSTPSYAFTFGYVQESELNVTWKEMVARNMSLLS